MNCSIRYRELIAGGYKIIDDKNSKYYVFSDIKECNITINHKHCDSMRIINIRGMIVIEKCNTIIENNCLECLSQGCHVLGG